MRRTLLPLLSLLLLASMACHHSGPRRQLLRAAAGNGAAAEAARQELLELNRADVYPGWITARSAHFVLHAPRGSPPALDPGAWLARREEAYARIVGILGVEPDGPIHVYAYLSNRQGEELLGRPLAFADPVRREIHVRHDQEPGHEETHVVAWALNGRGSGVPFLEEGLAVALSSHPGSPQLAAADLLARGVLPALPDLIERFQAFRHGYPLAGSFVEMFLERFGAAALRQLYAGGAPGFIPRMESITGHTLDELQSWWETVLAAQEPVTREPIYEALSLLRLGEADAAVRLLQARREEMPASPVVEYALALALRDSGDLDGSRDAFRRLLELPLPYRLAWMRPRAQAALQDLEGRGR